MSGAVGDALSIAVKIKPYGALVRGST